MSRAIPTALAEYLRGHATEACLITKLGPLPDGTYRYFADLDEPVAYDDGDGEQTYIARTGMQVSAFVSAADLGVDNAELDTLPPVAGYEVEGVTTEQVKSGELDGVQYVTYCIAYRRTDLGHFIWSGGNIGEARIRGAALLNLEQRSLSNKLKQLIGDVDSTTCRAIFGSQPIGTGGGVVEEKFPCGYDLTPEWVQFTVTDVHPTDGDMIFYTTDLAQADDYFRFGMVKWDTGDNVGQEREIGASSLDAGEQTITLAYALPRPVQVGDMGWSRRGCNKNWTGTHGCGDYWGTQKAMHFRGEPWQPLGDAGVNMIGGAGVSGDTGGTGENPAPATTPPETTGGGNGTPGSPPARTIGATVVTPSLSTGEASAAANSTAINAAIAGLTSGGVVRIPAGEWYVNTANPVLMDKNNLKLDLATNNATLLAAYSSTVTTSSLSRHMVIVDGSTEWEIVGGRMVGYRDAWAANGGASVHGVSEWAHGIYVRDGTSGNIRDISIEKCVGDAVSIGRLSSDVYVDNVELTNCRRQGISTGGDDIVIDNFDISYIGGTDGTAPKSGIDVEVDSPETATNITIRNGRSHHNSGPGLLCVTRTSNITIENVTVDYNSNHGILLDNSTTGTITGCAIEHNRFYGIKADDGSDGWTIGGAGADANAFFNNQTALHGVVTTGNTATITGTSTATRDHIAISSDSTVSVLANTYRA